jgi:hypothetical protein
MPSLWSAPSTKDAYRLSWVSIAAEVCAATAGISLFMVRRIILEKLKKLKSEPFVEMLDTSLLLDDAHVCCHHLPDSPCIHMQFFVYIL